VNPAWARLYQEMTVGVNTGLVDWEKGRARERGATDLKTVLLTLVPRSNLG
jgi:hypothetical protein